MEVARALGIITSTFLFLAGCVSMLLFAAGLLLDTRGEKLCCPTLISCHPCDNPLAPAYWPLLLALALFTAGGLFLGVSLRRRGGAT